MKEVDKRKALFYVAFAGVVVLILILLSFARIPIKEYLIGLPSAKSQTVSLLEELFEIIYKIVYILLWMLLVVSIVKFFNTILAATILSKVKNAELASLLQSVVSVVIYVFAFITIVRSQFQTDLTTLFAGGTILGVVLGLALQDTLGNLFAGLALQADQPFQIGDVVNIPSRNITGIVENVTWRGVRIRSFQNKILLVSNSVLGKELIEVAPKDGDNARLLFFSTIYSESPAKVARVVREVVRQVENVSSKFRPIVRIRNLGDNGIEWEIKYWLEDYSKYNDTDATIRMRIWYAFKREGISFAYPVRTFYFEEKLMENPQSKEKIDEVFERLRQVSIFEPLSDEELKSLIENVKVQVYSPNEPITREGQEGDSMFVVHKGAVKVQVVERDIPKTIAVLKEGGFFGEMSLFTGEPRSATVIASNETTVLKIDKDSIKKLLDANPELVEAFSKVIAERKQALLEKSKALHLEKKEKVEETSGIIEAIRRFFGIRS
ncbi:MAG: mechanosensitive ion channel family protein [Pyrinomonadaceae bacterium]|nr:mechanosensitive ion channel family protein [Pyrinomonadaceae bacterium]MCX7640564.1 mechanosensitive ion channel family protein [Pyrinomonadaceae bacterium]MDW8303855.1 mechanosensitive ion channel family protein [Acidobacteriota bacterium]